MFYTFKKKWCDTFLILLASKSSWSAGRILNFSATLVPVGSLVRILRKLGYFATDLSHTLYFSGTYSEFQWDFFLLWQLLFTAHSVDLFHSFVLWSKTYSIWLKQKYLMMNLGPIFCSFIFPLMILLK